MDPTFPLVPIANFLACIIVLIPLFSTSIRSGSWNIAVITFALWTSAYSLVRAVNSIIWSDNVKDVAPIWCDIASHFEAAANMAPRACTFVITRSLYFITDYRHATHKKCNKTIFDLGWTVGLPLVMVPLYTIVQNKRYSIIEEYGCPATATESILQILLLDVPTVMLPLISAICYCPRIISAVYKLRKDFNDISPVVDPQLISGSIYYRVIILGCVDVALTLPLGIFQLVCDLTPPPTSFYPGWRVVHANMQFVTVVPLSLLGTDPLSVFKIYFDLWINPILAGIFFALFGLTSEARATYRSVLRKAIRPIWAIESKPSQGTPRTLSGLRFGRINTSKSKGTDPRHTLVTAIDDSANTEQSGLGPSQEESGSVLGAAFAMSPEIEDGPSVPKGTCHV